MKIRFLFLVALMTSLNAAGFAAPSMNSAALPPAELQTGVAINATTRNDTQSATPAQLAKDGKALMPIVLSEKASDAVKTSAAELKKYLDQMTGATFEIKTGDGSSGIVLGNKTDFPTPELDNALAIFHSIDGKEAYAIRTDAKRVLLLGATDLGASHAAFRFLQELGCRWFFPSDNWEIIPTTTDVKFQKDITDRPAFLSRNIWYAWWLFSDNGHPGSTKEHPRSASSDYGEWKLHNNMAESFVVNAGHSYDTIVSENAAAFAAHPEYFALIKQADGTMKRQGNQFELSNPALRKLVVDWAVD
ncbi:MAG: DUF4838 domain-containing protein, partial [Abditibacteriaceae bacterium]